MTDSIFRYVCEYPLYLHGFYSEFEIDLKGVLPKLNTLLLENGFQIDGDFRNSTEPSSTYSNEIPFRNSKELEQLLNTVGLKKNTGIIEQHITINDFTCAAILNESNLNDPSRERWTIRINEEEKIGIPTGRSNNQWAEKSDRNWESFMQIVLTFFEVFSPPLFCFMSSFEENFTYPNLPIAYFEPLPQIYPMNFYSFRYMNALGITLSRIQTLDLYRLYELDSGIFFVPNSSHLGYDYKDYFSEAMQMLLGNS